MSQETRYTAWAYLGVAILFCGFVSPVSAQVMEVRHSVHHDVSPALRDLPAVTQNQAAVEQEAEPVRVIPLPGGSDATTGPDPVLQSVTHLAPLQLSPTIGLSFAGLGNAANGFTVHAAPPDTNGAVGRTQ